MRETLIVAESTRRSMQSNRSVDSKPEVVLRTALWKAGLRGYRKNVKKLPGKPDIVFGKAKLAICVHGCFWHGCKKCKQKYRTPKTNPLYWTAKIQGNQQRDERNRVLLVEMGYEVLVFWECELGAKPAASNQTSTASVERKSGLELAVEKIRIALGRAQHFAMQRP